MVFGYCRISTPQQNIERQKRNILSCYPNARLFCEAYSGAKADRPNLVSLLRQLKEGDTLVFDSVSRMSRNAEDGFALYRELYEKGVRMVFLKEPHINTDTYRKALEQNIALTGTPADYIIEGVNRYLLALAEEQIRIAFEQSQKEVDDLRQRTREGIQTARLAGKQIGAPAGKKRNIPKAETAKEKILKHSKDFGGTLSDTELIAVLGISRNSFYKYKREVRN